jgi:hypothetical protein
VVAALGGPASIVLPLSSTTGATVPDGSTVTRDADGSTWTLDGAVTIPPAGTANGTFTVDGPADVSALETWTILSARNVPSIRLHERVGFLTERVQVWHHKWYDGG